MADRGELLTSLAEFPKVLIGQKRCRAPLKGPGEKAFTLEGTQDEELSLQTFLTDQLSALSEVRVVAQKSLSVATWKAEEGLAEVTDQRGSHWQTHGHAHLGRLVLQPEEALFLMECGSLEIRNDGGVPFSIQQAYHTMLTDISLIEYQVYASLKRLGYTVCRVQLISSEERQQKCVSEQLEDVEQDTAIPGKGGEGGSRGEGERAEEIKRIETVSCCPLCTSVHILASGMSLLEVYQCRSHFRKTDPGRPHFRVVVASPTDPFPPPTLIQALGQLEPRAPVKFCVVDGASIAYYSLTHTTVAPLLSPS